MKLYEIPKKSIIDCECDDGSTYITFNHLDGMYSHCTTEKGGTVHLGTHTELELQENGHYKLK